MAIINTKWRKHHLNIALIPKYETLIDDHNLIMENILVLIQMIPGYKKENQNESSSKADLINGS